jgi:DNA-binding transcriptional regulator YdaS (Cro superfamily)
MTLNEWLMDVRKKSKKIMMASGRFVCEKGTQEWLALQLGVDQGLVSRWVKRKTTPETYGPRIVKLSRGKVTLAELERLSSSRS